MKQEGDGCNKGTYSVLCIIALIELRALKPILMLLLEKDMFWSDCPQSEHYKKLI